jgi:hypothetical protein
MTFRSLPNPRQAKLICGLAMATVLLSGALFMAVALVPAPLAALPLAAAVCIGCPLVTAWNVPVSIAVLRSAAGDGREGTRRGLDKRALAELRRTLDRLPETDHPLGH